MSYKWNAIWEMLNQISNLHLLCLSEQCSAEQHHNSACIFAGSRVSTIHHNFVRWSTSEWVQTIGKKMCCISNTCANDMCLERWWRAFHKLFSKLKSHHVARIGAPVAWQRLLWILACHEFHNVHQSVFLSPDCVQCKLCCLGGVCHWLWKPTLSLCLFQMDHDESTEDSNILFSFQCKFRIAFSPIANISQLDILPCPNCNFAKNHCNTWGIKKFRVALCFLSVVAHPLGQHFETNSFKSHFWLFEPHVFWSSPLFVACISCHTPASLMKLSLWTLISFWTKHTCFFGTNVNVRHAQKVVASSIF